MGRKARELEDLWGGGIAKQRLLSPKLTVDATLYHQDKTFSTCFFTGPIQAQPQWADDPMVDHAMATAVDLS